jgi:hypothetical protein
MIQRKGRPVPLPRGNDTKRVSNDWLHYQQHKQLQKCVRCQWGKHKRVWKPRLPVIQKAMSSHAQSLALDPDATWVRIRKDEDNKYHVTCTSCEDFQSPMMRWWFLRRHHQSRRHIANTCNKLGINLGPTGLPTTSAPTTEQFMAVWESSARNADAPASMSTWKHSKIQKCLVQALLRRDRELVTQATTLVIIRDESKGVLLVRVRLCTAALQDHAFLLGLRRDAGADALDITSATSDIIDSFF